MKLLQALREQIAIEQMKVANMFAKEVGFKSANDTSTVIEKNNAKNAWKWLVKNKQLLLDSFPKENVKKLILVDKLDAETDLGVILIIFKQILRSQKARLISRKRYDWNPTQRRQSYCLEYRIISATPDITGNDSPINGNKLKSTESSQESTKKRKLSTTEQTTSTSETQQKKKTLQSPNTKILDTQVVNTNVVDTQMLNTNVVDTKILDTQVVNTNVVDTNVVDTTTPDITVLDTTTPDTQMLDTTTPDITVLDTTTSDTKVLDTTTPDATVNDTNVVDTQVLNTSPSSTNVLNTSPSSTNVLNTNVSDATVLDTSPSLSKSPTVVHSPLQALSPTN